MNMQFEQAKGKGNEKPMLQSPNALMQQKDVRAE